jgi:hypothetical protein
MCLACQEEAFYQAYLAHMEKKAKEAAAAEKAGSAPAVCDEVKDRVEVEISAREAGSKQ